MTKEEILAMEGNRLKAEVASQIMGIKVEYPFAEGYPYYLREDKDGKMKWDVVPDYSGDISAAWQVVEKMVQDLSHQWFWEIHYTIDWVAVSLTCPVGHEQPIWHGVEEIEGKTAPEAICKAALLTKYSDRKDSV